MSLLDVGLFYDPWPHVQSWSYREEQTLGTNCPGLP